MQPLTDFRIVSLAFNLPGPAAAARLRELGAEVTKVEPPAGDPLAHRQEFYQELTEGQEIVSLNLKDKDGLAQLHVLLQRADLLLTSTRPAALARLDLSWKQLHAKYPQLSQVAIVGFPSPDENRPGHDLTYQSQHGLLTPPHMPRALVADIGGAQEAVIAAVGLLLGRERGKGTAYVEVSLADAARRFAVPLKHGMTAPDGLLGGSLPGYNLYEAKSGWVAVGCLEPHFWEGLLKELNPSEPTIEAIQAAFREKTAVEWEEWAAERDLPIEALREPEPDE